MSEKNYDELLDRCWDALPDKLKDHQRYELPIAQTFIEGNQTIIKNFNEIANSFSRKPNHILTFLLKELAAPGTIEGNRVIIQRVLKKDIINKRLEDYANEYVLCHECKRPDTVFTELGGERIIKCEACGGWSPLRRIK